MRAAYIERFGSPDEIRFAELPDPRPRSTEVLVDVLATTVNPVDTFVRSGRFRTEVAFPFVIGRDLVGKVVRAGGDVGRFLPGELVWSNSLGHAGRQGPTADQAVVPADRIYRLPGNADPYEAIAVFHPAATACLALFTHGDLRAGDTVLVEGAAGNVGSAATALAVRAGARVIATAAAGDADHCASLGAEHVVDYRDPDLWRRVARAAPHGIDVHLDASGRNNLDRVVPLLAHRGRVVLLAGTGARVVLPAGELYMKDASVRGFVISHATPAELAEAASTINGLLASGELRPRGLVTSPLESVAEVHRRMEAGLLHGRRAVLRT